QYVDGMAVRLLSTDVDETTTGLDTIDAGDGSNRVIGGFNADRVTTGDGVDVILGDAGELIYVDNVITRVTSAETSIGGADTIQSGDGDNVILAGPGADSVVTGIGDDVVLGDTGEVLFDTGRLQSIMTSNEGDGEDHINTDAGDDIIFSGLGSDVINSGADNDIVIADTGVLNYNFTSEPAVLIRNDVDANLGGNDIVNLGAGNDIGLGGAGSDSIRGEEGEDAIFGDFVNITIANSGLRDFQSTLPTFGASDILSGGDGFDIMVGGSGFDYYDGSLITDVIIGNYARIQDSADFTSLLIVSDPTNREVISSSLFSIYGVNTDIAQEEDDDIFIDSGDSDAEPLRIDTALRLTPLLNGEELSRLSDQELQEFLRNLPLLGVEQRRGSGHTSRPVSVPVEEQKPTAPVAPDDAIIPVAMVNERPAQDRSWLSTASDSEKSVDGEATELDREYAAPASEPLSDSLAIGLLLAANVAGQRGWRLGRLSNEDNVIQGDLQDLRRAQSSRKYSIWQKKDLT
ncbi:calcium-binding protein, partial [Amphritea atlantica]|uniref:calcium-binding protein n=1 Tax=Amphritea atlantica TaxID=355243 RepID=UPI001C07E3BD